MEFTNNWPPQCVFGSGSAKHAGDVARKLGVKRALIVTDKGLVGAGIAEKISQALKREGLDVEILPDVKPNPTMEEVRTGIDLWKEGSFDLLVGLGGGSPIDAAKVIACALFSERSLEEMVSRGVDDAAGEPVPFIAIPTTSGTGSEATSAAMIKDDDGRKHLVRSFKCRPSLAILDPALTLSVPPRMTAATGLDAFIHALGAYTNKSVNPIADIMARDAIARIRRNLVQVVEHGDDLNARTEMMLASHLAGMAISLKGNDAIHGLSTAVESVVDVTHGESLSAILPHIVEFNMETQPEKYLELANALEVPSSGKNGDLRHAVKSAIIGLRDEIGTTRKLSDLGVSSSEVERLSAMAVGSRSTQLNCRELGEVEIAQLYRAML